MKVSRERYQHGSVRKVPRSQGFAWEFRFYLTAPDGKRKLKVQTFDSLKYPTERDVRKAVEGQLSALNAGTLGGKLAATMGTIIERYMAEDFLAKAAALFDGKLGRIPHPSVLAIATRHRVSAYDARFLSLADQLGSRLITEDARLRAAAPALTQSLAEALAAA